MARFFCERVGCSGVGVGEWMGVRGVKGWCGVGVLPPCPRCGQAVDKVWCGFGEILGE